MILEQIPTSPLGTNCYVLGDEQTGRAVVIDPGNDAPLILEALRRTQVTAEAIVVTHGHWDHLGAVRAVRHATGAPFLAPAGDVEMIRAAGTSALLMGVYIDPPPDPDRTLSDGDVLTVGTLTLQVRAAPGHTPGHIILVGPGIAFVGDVVFAGAVGRTDLPGGDWEALEATLREVILALPEDTLLYPGHGPATTVGRERASNPFLVDLRPAP
ncbi:MAG: MBL fold metallo-hydrolase [Armatimonadota bacterium]|nr:MBL fold metallo-hydrolase [Armatimonadota bacterium]MDR7437982.1 MBL fold metallo-hydrolase [Armatimonadota bacterium]MDR7473064.1 MBL fold metallo-hydrolase [Armatimonadota bacterium]MDR7509401.1 MBL fold metallo-hydrolase [Armatimonadota bacterium]MDR7516314.1 MBL fold metallo-hydrolase [Armatimonadota bacterium]